MTNILSIPPSSESHVVHTPTFLRQSNSIVIKHIKIDRLAGLDLRCDYMLSEFESSKILLGLHENISLRHNELTAEELVARIVFIVSGEVKGRAAMISRSLCVDSLNRQITPLVEQ